MTTTKGDLNDVAVFNRVAEAGSFSAAARALKMPRASVSRVIARLEDAVGAQLFYRTTRRVELTEAGRSYYQSTARGLALIAEAGEALAAARAEPEGLLRVTAPINFATLRLIPWMAEFLAQHAKVRIVLTLVEGQVDPIEAGVDIAIVTGRLPDSSYRVRRLATSALVLVASPDYLARKTTPHTLEDLSAHEAILSRSDQGSERWTLNGPDGQVEISVTGRFAVAGPHAELSAAVSGMGIALLPEAVVGPFLKAGRLVHMLPQYHAGPGTISAVFAANRHQSAAFRAFLDFLAARSARDEVGPDGIAIAGEASVLPDRRL